MGNVATPDPGDIGKKIWEGCHQKPVGREQECSYVSFDVQRRPLATTIWPKVSTVPRLTNLPSRIIQPRLQRNGRGRRRLGSTPGPPSRLQTMGPGPARVSQVSAKPASRPAHDPPSLMQPPPPPANGGPVRKERTHHEPQRRGRRGRSAWPLLGNTCGGSLRRVCSAGKDIKS